MVAFSRPRILASFRRCDETDSTTEKGRELEELITYIFNRVPGIELHRRNSVNDGHSQEIDLAFWNSQTSKGFHFFDNIVLCECKNWVSPVDSSSVSFFLDKMRRYHVDAGFLVAASGITGSATGLSAAHDQVRTAFEREKLRLIVLTREHLENLSCTEDLISLTKDRLLSFAVGQFSF